MKATTVKQQQVNDNLQQQVNELKALINNSTSAFERTSQSVALNSLLGVGGGAFMAQNVPNYSINNGTRINCNIPKGPAKAKVIIADAYGKRIKQIVLSNAEKGMLKVDVNGLAAGTFSCTLFVDGRMVETMKMVAEN